MKKNASIGIVLSILLSLFLQLSSIAQCPPEYLAVFGDPGLVTHWLKYCPHKPDYYVKAESFDELDNFLIKAKKESRGKLLVIDIDCHGSYEGYLHINGKKTRNMANMGMILNHVESIVKEDFTLCFECCYGQMLYEKRNMVALHTSNIYLEPYKGVPTYPVYGGGVHPTLNTTTYESVHHSRFITVRDLRYGKGVLEPEGDNFSLYINSLELGSLTKLDKKH